jgi:antitoxin component of MazEF toxin-antitoxin module
LLTRVVKEEERKIAKSGGTAVLYVPKEYFTPGDIVKVTVEIVNGQIKLTAEKKFYNFDLGDIRELAKQYGFTTEYDKELADTLVFSAQRKDGVSMSYTQSLRETIAPGCVALSRKLEIRSLKEYRYVNSLAENLKRLDAIVKIEGDLDTINVLKEPGRYNLAQDEAIELILKSARKPGLSLVVRFDNRKNKLEEVRSALEQLTKLESKPAA